VDGTPLPAPDAELLSGLCGRKRSSWQLVLGATFAVGAVGQLAQGHSVPTVLFGLAALGYAVIWWAGPQPRLRAVTDDALLVRRGLRTRSIARAEIEDARARYGTGYGVLLTLRDADPIELTNAAPRFSVADAQAAALRRWAGLS